MLSLRNINPMVRAIGTMGAIAALVGGITFAAEQSTAVTLSPNTLTSSTAALAIGADNSCPGGDTTSTPGITATLVPGVTSSGFNFCLNNTGNIPLSITAQIPTTFATNPTTNVPPTDVTLTLNCPTIGTLSGTLDQYNGSAVSFPGGQLPVGSPIECTETAELSSSYTGTGNQTVTPFAIDFVGNQ